jgi:hypothetical protein
MTSLLSHVEEEFVSDITKLVNATENLLQTEHLVWTEHMIKTIPAPPAAPSQLRRILAASKKEATVVTTIPV